MTLEARDITFGYEGRTPLYEGLCFEVEPQERVAIAAPSGAGKTTLCRILAGYVRPQAGEVRVDGVPLSPRGACPVQLIGQHPENALDPRMRMEASLAEAKGCTRELVRALGIRDEWMRRFPHELSGGELQRFCIARALGASPRYLIADEISTMLDAVTQSQIWRFLLEQVRERNMGLVFVSHSPALSARIATRVVDVRKLAHPRVRD